MVQFEELSDEIVLKVFSYLPQNALCKVAKVSRKWRQMAYDPSLWKEVVIDRRSGFSVETLLERAKMLSTLDLRLCSVALERVSKLSQRFVFLKQLCVQFTALTDPALLSVLNNCRTIEVVVLHGNGMLLTKEVKVLGGIFALKNLIVTDRVLLDDGVFIELCDLCRDLQLLVFNTKLIHRSATWQHIEKLCHLRSLSVSRISTRNLHTVSRNCPSVRVLEIGSIFCDGVSVTEALRKFEGLKKLLVVGDSGGEWFDSEQNLSSQLEVFDVKNLKLEEKHVRRLANGCATTLRNVSVSGARFTRRTLQCLFLFESLEDVSIGEVPDGVSALQMVPRLPRLRELKLSKCDITAEIAKGLKSIVNVTDCSEHGQTMLTVNVFCSSQEDQDMFLRELYAFKEYLLLNTRLSLKHIHDFEDKWWQLKDSKLYWLPYGNRVSRTIETRFPVVGGRLRRLVLTGSGC